MAACRWCKAAVKDPAAACPRCGRRPDEAAVLPGVVDVPDLDIPARPSKAGLKAAPAAPAVVAPAAAARVAPPAAKVASGVLSDPGNRFEDDDDVEGAKLDLDLSKGPPLIAGAGGKLGARKAAASSAGTPPVDGPQPKEVRAVPAPVLIDPYEARALADYGDAPSQWWRTPLYAYRVLRRRPELKRLAGQRRREAERAEGAAEDALLAFAELVRSKAEKLGGYARAFEDVRASEAVLRERDAVLAEETDAHKQRQTEFDARIGELEASLSEIQIEERSMASELSEADILLKRADARVKRVEIEIRNAISQAGGDASGDPKGAGP